MFNSVRDYLEKRRLNALIDESLKHKSGNYSGPVVPLKKTAPPPRKPPAGAKIKYLVVYIGRSVDNPPYRDFDTWDEANRVAEAASMVERVEVYKVTWNNFNLDMGYNPQPGGQRGVYGQWRYERGQRV